MNFARLVRTFHSSATLARKPKSILSTFSNMDDDKPRYQDTRQETPDLHALPQRWPTLDQLDRDEISIFLDDRAKGDWRQLTREEKQAIWYVNYGTWGPRAERQTEPGRIYGAVAGGLALALVGVTGYKMV